MRGTGHYVRTGTIIIIIIIIPFLVCHLNYWFQENFNTYIGSYYRPLIINIIIIIINITLIAVIIVLINIW